MLYQAKGRTPAVDPKARLADNCAVSGDVTLGAGVNVWYSAVLRGDTAPITVGEGSNIQDGVVVHGGRGFPVSIGKNVSVGHRAVVHGCTVEDECLIGMGSVLLNGCTIGAGSIVNKDILDYTVAVGNPCRPIRKIDERDKEYYWKDRRFDEQM